jgi:hypothetical protein
MRPAYPLAAPFRHTERAPPRFNQVNDGDEKEAAGAALTRQEAGRKSSGARNRIRLDFHRVSIRKGGMQPMANIDRWFLRIAVVYALVAMALGIVMGISEDHSQMPTHAHLNLVGWVSMALYALVYRQYPAAAQSRLAIPHFWIANIGALLLTVGVYTQMADMPSLAFIVISGSFITILGMLMFTGVIYSKV